MLPPELVLLASTNVPNKIVYGAYTQLEDAKAKRFVTYQSSRIPFVYGEEDDGTLFYRLTSCPLPMPVDVLGWRLIEAITGVSYPFPTPGEVAYFDPNDPEAGPPEAQPQGTAGVDYFPQGPAPKPAKVGEAAAADEHKTENKGAHTGGGHHTGGHKK